jgi:hypothetical protein
MDFGLADPANIGHPALFRVSPLPTPNNEKRHESADQRTYQKQLYHKTALCLSRIRIGEASGRPEAICGYCGGLINSKRDSPDGRKVAETSAMTSPVGGLVWYEKSSIFVTESQPSWRDS